MSPEAEELLRVFIAQMNNAGHVSCENTQSVAFHELEENGMLFDVVNYISGGYAKLSTKAIHYFEEKEAEQKRLEEQRLSEKKAEQNKLLHDVLLVVLGVVLTFLFQLLASAIFPKA